MPAIDLKRFSKETAELVEQFDQPAAFIASLRQIFDQYSNRTIKKKLSRAHTSGLPNANVPEQVISQIVIGLNKITISSPENTLKILDALWDEGTYETRLICAKLFHKLPPAEVDTIQRLNAFLSKNAEPNITAAFLRSGMRAIRQQNPIGYLAIIQKWLDSQNPRLMDCAVKSLIIHINDDLNINLPQIITLLTPEIRDHTLEHQFELIELIRSLAEQSAPETRYFLKEVLRWPIPRSTQIIFRKFSDDLPGEFPVLTKELLRVHTQAHKKI